MVKHIKKKASDHCMLILDTEPEMERNKRKFYLIKRCITKSEIEEVVKKTWEPIA